MISVQQKDTIKETVKKFEPTMLGIFGSYARNEQHHNSDLDILVDFKKKVHLLDLIGMEQELTEVLGIKVDLVTLRSLNQKLHAYIQKDLISIM